MLSEVKIDPGGMHDVVKTRNGERRTLCGLFTRRMRWGLSGRGWVFFALIASLGATVIVLNLHPFLALTARVPSDTLVVEGWVHEFAIKAAVREYYDHGYKMVFTTGGPVIGKGGYINDYNTSASVGAELLEKDGLPSSRVQMVPSRVMSRDRTYSSAVALRSWFAEHGIKEAAVNVLTEDAHARRTRLLFQKALGPKIQVGVIAVHSPDYQTNRWWQYSDGVREVIGETIAYVYAKLFFDA
jgi:uncharacterized SAM-binding protein YcdF (DUF218 family)